LIDRFTAHGDWRGRCAEAVEQLRAWLAANELDDARTELRLAQMRSRLADERLTVAFVAEFSRGKSELINAIFFSDLGQRVLPSSAGRTTMCPTELCWSEGMAPEIRLLPIDTRLRDEPMAA